MAASPKTELLTPKGYINLLKALSHLRSRKEEEATGTDAERDAVTLRCSGLLDTMGRALNVILKSGPCPSVSWADARW
jgi:hypothetical protein